MQQPQQRGKILEELKKARRAYINCNSGEAIKIVDDLIISLEDLSAPDSPEQDRFIQGYVCCVVTLLKSHGIQTAVSEAFQAGVGRIAKAVKAGCPDYDIEELKKHFK